MNTVYVTQPNVGIYVLVPDLRQGMPREAYSISPIRLLKVAERFGQLVVRSAFVDQAFMGESRPFSQWVGAGFRLLAIPGNKVNHQKKVVPSSRITSQKVHDLDEGASVIRETTLVHAPSGQAPLSEEVMRDVEERHLEIVILVGLHGFPPGLFGALRNRGIHLVAIAVNRDARVSRSADLVLYASDLADSKPIPNDLGEDFFKEDTDAAVDRVGNALRAMAVGELPIIAKSPRHIDPPVDESWPAVDYLEKTDAPTYTWIVRILAVTDADLNATLQLLLGHLKERELPKVALAVLVILNHHKPYTGSRAMPLDRIYTQLLRLDIDIDVIGRLALRLLSEEGTIALPSYGVGVYRGPVDHPVYILARSFFKNTMRRRGRLVPYQRSCVWVEQILSALEIFTTDPGSLDTRALQDVKDAMLFFAFYPTLEQRMVAYERLGLSRREGLKFEQQYREILSLPMGDRDSLRGEDPAPPDSADSAPVPLLAANGD